MTISPNTSAAGYGSGVRRDDGEEMLGAHHASAHAVRMVGTARETAEFVVSGMQAPLPTLRLISRSPSVE
ncbi:hypothetical protein BRAO285_1090001 [Bradyrhizobium sp. ORS 285]|nr:hypothetical protein BRAO285_1090001 [Bradyrhizobium sp. ORS 285]